jgi:hypothetical protein
MGYTGGYERDGEVSSELALQADAALSVDETL